MTIRHLSNYSLFNLILLVLLLAMVIWLIVSPVSVSCVYARHGLQCSTCGLTRQFQEALHGNLEHIDIHTRTSRIILFFIFAIFSRILLLFSSFKNPTIRLIRLDIVVSALLFILVFLVP